MAVKESIREPPTIEESIFEQLMKAADQLKQDAQQEKSKKKKKQQQLPSLTNKHTALLQRVKTAKKDGIMSKDEASTMKKNLAEILQVLNN